MTAPTVTRTNDNGTPNKAYGTLSGTYTAESDTYNSGGVQLDGSGNLLISLGFSPTHFWIINTTDLVKQEWYKGMPFGDFLETPADGNWTYETDNQVEVLVATTGTAPVTYNPTCVVTVNCGGGAMTDNDTVVWGAEG